MKLPNFVKNPYVAGSVLAGGGAIDAATHDDDTPLGDVAMGLGAATLLAPLLRGRLASKMDKIGRKGFDKNMAKRQGVMDAKTSKVEELLAKQKAVEAERDALSEAILGSRRNNQRGKVGRDLAKKEKEARAAKAEHTAALGDANRFGASMKRKDLARENRNKALASMILGASGIGTALGVDYADPFGGETL